MQTYSDPSRASDPHGLSEARAASSAQPNVEVFQDYYDVDNDDGSVKHVKGWYYWSCFPSCLPDSDPISPFDSADAARLAAQED